jgi:hypothetical protein
MEFAGAMGLIGLGLAVEMVGMLFYMKNRKK